ncbi:MAG TPA: DUF2179 domain-containing protein [candidate division Zixibacteria bacterium]|nr:DUF2179 domain-containing protein [candidate division Zixibacteria bacterium]
MSIPGGWVIPGYLVPLLIFCARILDVSIGTMRIIVVSRGMRLAAAIMGFFEVLIWLIAIGQVLQHLSGWISYFSYSAGFAAGTYVGMTIERRLAKGMSLIRMVVPGSSGKLVEELIKAGFRVTHLDAQGARGPVHIVFTIVRRRHINRVLALVNEIKPDTFYSIEDVRSIRSDPQLNGHYMRNRGLLQPFYWFRKGK